MTQQTIDVAPPSDPAPTSPEVTLSAATRCLCVGAYVDTVFRDDVDTSGVRARRATVLNNNGIFVGGNMDVSGGSVTNQAPEPPKD